MAAKKQRQIEASDRVSGLVDKGFDIDVDLKNRKFEDKGLKKILAESLESEFEKGPEISLRVEGSKAAALVTRTEKMVIKGDSEKVEVVREAAEKGLLGDVVNVVKELNVPVDDREKAAKILQDAGISATVSASMTVSPAEYRILGESESVSAESAEAKEVLDEVVETNYSYRVKYEKV